MKRLITIAGLALVFAAMFGLYELSYRVDRQEVRLRALTGRIATEKQSIAVLRAEWAYLTRPQAIQDRAVENLAMQPTLPGQVVTFHDVPDREKRLIITPDGDGGEAIAGVVLAGGMVLPLPRPRPAGGMIAAIAGATPSREDGDPGEAASAAATGSAETTPVRSAAVRPETSRVETARTQTARAEPIRPERPLPAAPPARRQAETATAQLEVAMRRPGPSAGARLLPAAMEARLLRVAAQQVSGDETARILIGGQ